MNNDDESNSCIYKNKKFLLILGLISFAVIIATMVILIIVLKKSKHNVSSIYETPEQNAPSPIKNNVKDLKSVYVNQNSTENITSNGILSEKNLLRKTIYEILFFI